MKLVVAGATGLIGRYLVPILLQQGHELTLLVRRAHGVVFSDHIRIIEIDLLKEAPKDTALLGDALINLAWITTPGAYLHSTENWQWKEASVDLARRFLDQGGDRLIVAGTCAEYAWNGKPCREDSSPLEPQNAYSSAKLATHDSLVEMIANYSAQLFWGRVFFPYGTGESPERLIPSALNSLLGGSTFACTHGRQRRDFIHASDVASAFARLVETDCPQGEYNISTGTSVSIRELVTICQDVTGSASSIDFGAIPLPETDPIEVLGVNEKLLGTGWRPKISLRQGIAQYAQHLRNPRHT